jgi:type II secretory pathway component PulF
MDSWFPTFQRLAQVRVELPLPTLTPLRSTAGQRRSLLRLIAIAMEENLPLAPLIEQWAADERGRQRYRLRRLAKLLQGGRSLSDAVEEIPGVLSDEEVLAIRFDAQSGTRTAAIRAMLAESPLDSASPRARARQILVYFCTVVPIAFVIITFLQLRIFPVFQKMLAEFGMPQPEVIGWSIRLSNTLLSYWWLVGMVIFFVLWTSFSTRAGRFVRYSIMNRLIQPLRELHAAEVLQKLAVALQAGRPIPGALSTLARYHFDPAVRHQLLFVRNEVEQGEDVWRSLGTVGLLAPADVRLLEAAERVGNRPWALAQVVGVKRRRTLRWLETISELLLPVLVLLMGAFVMFQSLTIFQPLVTLIEGLL